MCDYQQQPLFQDTCVILHLKNKNKVMKKQISKRKFIGHCFQDYNGVFYQPSAQYLIVCDTHLGWHKSWLWQYILSSQQNPQNVPPHLQHVSVTWFESRILCTISCFDFCRFLNQRPQFDLPAICDSQCFSKIFLIVPVTRVQKLKTVGDFVFSQNSQTTLQHSLKRLLSPTRKFSFSEIAVSFVGVHTNMGQQTKYQKYWIT